MGTVLLVEDSLTDTEVLTRYLGQAGFTVINVDNGEEALVKLQTQKPSLIILDVILPGQSGFELCHEIKTNDKTKQIPVIICSSKGTEADKIWGSMLGADAYLTKPVELQQLMEVLGRLVPYKNAAT